MRGSLRRFFVNTKYYGLRKAIKVVLESIRKKIAYATFDYDRWIKKHLPDDKTVAKQRDMRLEYSPRFSVLVLPDETSAKSDASDAATPQNSLEASVKAQTYTNWEIVRVDGDGESSAGKDLDLDKVSGDYVILCDESYRLMPDALFECAKLINDKKADAIYADSDMMDASTGRGFAPDFKPDYNVDLLRSCNYIGRMLCVSKKLIDKIGLYRKEAQGAQEYDFLLRCTEALDHRHIEHMPKILYREVRTADEADRLKLHAAEDEAGMAVLRAHYKRLGIAAAVTRGEEIGIYKSTYEIDGEPLISIIIPNKDHIEDLRKCISSIEDRSDYRSFEFVIVENNSKEDATFEYYREIEQKDNVKVVYWDKEFNYSAINNYGVEHAEGEYLLLLNNDTEIINPDCISHMLGICMREDVGAVGARLYYEDGTVQHAGVVMGWGGIAGHIFKGLDERDGLYHERTKTICDYNAVTAACLMVKKSTYEAIGGMETDFKVAFNDIDFCLRIRALNKLVVYDAYAKLYHYESKSRGKDDTLEKKRIFEREIRLFEERWGDILEQGDPYYNVNLSLDKVDLSLRV